MKNFSLKFKLMALSIFLVSISMVIGIVSYLSNEQVVKDYSVIADVSFPNTTTILQMSANNRAMRIEALHLISSLATAEMKKEAIEAIESTLKLDKELHQKYMNIEFLSGEVALYEEFRKGIDELAVFFKTIVELSEKSDAASLEEANIIVFQKIPLVAKKNRVDLKVLRDFHAKHAENTAKNAKDHGNFTHWLIIGMILGLGSIGFITAFIFSGALSKSLQNIGQTLDDASSHVSAAAAQIASSADELSQATTEQASALQETSSSVDEMSSMVKINFENSKRASENSLVSKKQAEKGHMVVEEMVQSMNQIDASNTKIMEQINHSNNQMHEIVKVIQEIGNKTKVINDIVFQTKLLSFNASVEAARAGEQGKGFAVVAEEVGNLAQMSGNAAKEISDMLASSVEKVESIASETKVKVDAIIAEGREKIKSGTNIAKECGEVLLEIVSNVTNVSTMAIEISNASDEQSKGIHEITKSMAQLDQVTQANAATSQQAASAAEELSMQSRALKNQVSTLVSVINGAAKVSSKENFSSYSASVNKFHDSNVVPMIKPAHAAVSAAAKVAAQMPEMKKAVGMSTKESVPSCDHPGFEEV